MITFITNNGLRPIAPYLAHHGIKGQEWGKRRLQYADGRLTPEGRIRYRKGIRTANVYRKEAEKARRKYEKALTSNIIYNRNSKNLDEKRETYERAKAKSEHFEALMKETFGDIQEKYGDIKAPKVDREKINDDLDAAIADYYKSKGDDYTSDTEDPEYLDKVKTSSGDTRYFYDEDELKAYKDGKSGATDKDLDDAFKEMRRTAKTGEENDRREDAWERARDKDLYDIDFLEEVQNSAALHNGDTKTLLTEYAYYLSDPDNYWEKYGSKLYEP